MGRGSSIRLVPIFVGTQSCGPFRLQPPKLTLGKTKKAEPFITGSFMNLLEIFTEVESNRVATWVLPRKLHVNCPLHLDAPTSEIPPNITQGAKHWS